MPDPGGGRLEKYQGLLLGGGPFNPQRGYTRSWGGVGKEGSAKEASATARENDLKISSNCLWRWKLDLSPDLWSKSGWEPGGKDRDQDPG